MERFRTFESVFVMAAIGGTGVVSEFLKQQLECFLSTLKDADVELDKVVKAGPMKDAEFKLKHQQVVTEPMAMLEMDDDISMKDVAVEQKEVFNGGSIIDADPELELGENDLEPALSMEVNAKAAEASAANAIICDDETGDQR